MAKVPYIVNIKNPKVKFRVLKFDKATGIGILQGEYGAEFTRNLTKVALTQYGYEGKVLEEDAASKKPKAG